MGFLDNESSNLFREFVCCSSSKFARCTVQLEQMGWRGTARYLSAFHVGAIKRHGRRMTMVKMSHVSRYVNKEVE